ncbi:MAG: DUF2273 domain-containing protein [Tissierellia bacterium]|nr:DUF2273 domain-containing protein [Tissierellia bacterium]
MKVYLVPDENQKDQQKYLGEFDLLLSPKGGNIPTKEKHRLGNTMKEGANGLKKRWDSPKTKFYLRRYRYTIRSIIIAIVLALLFLNLGFARTIGVLLLLIIGFLVGGVLDKNPIVLRLLRRLR